MSIFTKIGGGVVFFIGLLITIGTPWLDEYQWADLARFGIIFGIIVMGIGVWLMTL